MSLYNADYTSYPSFSLTLLDTREHYLLRESRATLWMGRKSVKTKTKPRVLFIPPTGPLAGPTSVPRGPVETPTTALQEQEGGGLAVMAAVTRDARVEWVSWHHAKPERPDASGRDTSAAAIRAGATPAGRAASASGRGARTADQGGARETASDRGAEASAD
jgi:hypothetical protein